MKFRIGFLDIADIRNIIHRTFCNNQNLKISEDIVDRGYELDLILQTTDITTFE